MRSLSLSDKKTSTAAASPSASVEARRREAAQLSKAILKGKWSALKAKFLSRAYQGGSHILNAWAEAGVGPVPMDTSVTLIRIQNDGSFSIEREDRNGAPRTKCSFTSLKVTTSRSLLLVKASSLRMASFRVRYSQSFLRLLPSRMNSNGACLTLSLLRRSARASMKPSLGSLRLEESGQ